MKRIFLALDLKCPEVFWARNYFLKRLNCLFIDDDECVECEAILEELETVDDEADAYGIDFVKNNDPHAARQYNIYNTPALVYFRRMSPVV